LRCASHWTAVDRCEIASWRRRPTPRLRHRATRRRCAQAGRRPHNADHLRHPKSNPDIPVLVRPLVAVPTSVPVEAALQAALRINHCRSQSLRRSAGRLLPLGLAWRRSCGSQLGVTSFIGLEASSAGHVPPRIAILTLTFATSFETVFSHSWQFGFRFGSGMPGTKHSPGLVRFTGFFCKIHILTPRDIKLASISDGFRSVDVGACPRALTVAQVQASTQHVHDESVGDYAVARWSAVILLAPAGRPALSTSPDAPPIRQTSRDYRRTLGRGLRLASHAVARGEEPACRSQS